MRYFLLLTFSIFSFADDHRISTDFSEYLIQKQIILLLHLLRNGRIKPVKLKEEQLTRI